MFQTNHFKGKKNLRVWLLNVILLISIFSFSGILGNTENTGVQANRTELPVSAQLKKQNTVSYQRPAAFRNDKILNQRISFYAFLAIYNTVVNVKLNQNIKQVLVFQHNPVLHYYTHSFGNATYPGCALHG